MTDRETLEEKIYRRALTLFRDGIAESALVDQNGEVAKPIPVHDPGGAIESWFVGIVIEDKLAGYLRFGSDLALLGYSSFQRRPDSIDGCPQAPGWLDPAAVLAAAREFAKPGNPVGQPMLGYDRYPARLAWRVDVADEDGSRKLLMLAGAHAYWA